MTIPAVFGLDVGTTETKLLVTTPAGDELLAVTAPTRWRVRGGAFTEADPDQLTADVLELLSTAVAAAAEQVGELRVLGIGITGIAEAGVLLDHPGPAGKPLYPIIAWFDPRGGPEVRALPADVLADFEGTTGLPVSALAAVAKWCWMRSQGTDLAGRRWLNVPEYLAYRLCGGMATEYSLFARTGLMDQDTEDIWPRMLESLGATADLIPQRVRAGTPFGRAAGPGVPDQAVGAAVTVAGHDHPVAAVGSGVVGVDEVFDSFGTAEALVRTVAGPLRRDARQRLAHNGINSVHHVLEGRRLLLAGTKSGLLMRRTLQLLGATDTASRDQLDAAACAAMESGVGTPEGVTVTGADNNDGSLRVLVGTDGIGPTELWLATLSHGVEEAGLALDRMAAEVGPASGATVGGGWARMASVRLAKSRSLPKVRFSDRTQAGALGAAMFAAYAAQTLAAAGPPAAAGDDPDVVPTPGPTQEFAELFTGGATRPADIPLEEIIA